MKIAFNPSTVAALTTPPNNKDITFDLRGRNIFARGVEFKGTDTNTWRDIKINNVSIGSHTLDLQNGSNTTLTNTNGVVTINSTWRPVVDNLTSDSTTSSLSAKQGKVLKALIDGKSNSDHNHDGRYLKLTGGTMASNALITFADSGSYGTDKGPQGARGGLYWTGQSDYAKLYAEETAGDNLDLVIQFGDDNSNGLSIRNKANTQTSYISAGGVITTGTFKGNLDWPYITNKPSSYTPSAHTHAWNSLTHSSTTENQAILTNGKANGWKLQTLNIARWDNAANNAHSHANKSVLDGITSALVNSWNTAYNFVSNITGTDTDKVINKWEEIVNFLAGITEDNKLNTLLNSKLSIQQLSAKDILTTKTNNALFWVDTKGNASTITTGPFTDHPYALLSVTNYNQNAENDKFFYRSRLAFSSAGDIKVASCHHEFEYQQDETWYNVLTSKNSGISGSTIKLNGTSITVYSSGTADGRYVKKSGDTMQGGLTIDTTNFGALTIKRNDDAKGATIQFRGKSSVYGYIGLDNSTKDKQFLRWSSDTSRAYTILDTSSTYISNGKGVINGTTITQVDNATNSTNSTNARKLVNWYSARPTSLNAQFGDGSLRIFYATSSTTEGKPAEDSHILHLAWDNTGGYDAQLAVHACSGKVSTRAQNGGTWQPWKTLAFTSDIPDKDSWNYDDRYLRLTGGWMSGDIKFGGDNKIYWGRNTDSASISFKNDGDGDANSYMSFATSDNGNEYFRWSHSSGSTNTEWMALRSEGLRVRGTKVSLEGHSHNDLYYTKAESNAKYITDIATSVNKLTFTRNGSNIARNITVDVVYSQGYLTNIPNKDATTKAISGLYIYNSYNQVIGTNSYSSVLSINTGGTIQIAGNWGDIQTRNLYWRSQSDGNVADYPWKSWRTILDSENYSSTLDSRYYTETEVNSLLDAKLNRQNLSCGTWNPRGQNFAANYSYNGGDIAISENNGKMFVTLDGWFWQNEGQYRVLDTSDIGDIQGSVTLHQYLEATDAAWYPLVWGGNAHKNTSESTGAVYKSYDKLCWQTSSQTLYATRLQSEFLTTPVIRVIGTSDNMAWNRGSGRIVFAEDVSNSQAVSLVYTSYDSVRAPAGIRLTGSQGNEWFEASRLIKTGSNDNYVLLGAGGHILKGNANGNIPINNGTVNTNLNADLLDGYHASSFIKMKQFRFRQFKEGFWTKILTITINSTSDLEPVIAFNWIPSECAREVWAEFTINWRSNSPIFYAIWKGTAVRTLTCVNSSGNIWDVWVQGDKSNYDPFGEVQVTYAHNISSYNGGSLGYSDSDPGGTRCTLGGYVNYAKSTGNADTVDGQHASAFSYKSWWHWYGKDGQPNWLWGGNNENDYYVYNPSNFRVAYAASAGNADTLGGYPVNDRNVAPYGCIPTVKSDGVMEVGKYIDFHDDNSDKYDLSTRLQSTGNYRNIINLPSVSGTLALINDINNYYWANVKISASSSTTTSPTVSNLIATSSIRMGSIRLESTNEINSSDNLFINYGSSTNVSLCQGGGIVGIGTISPTQKLDVCGNIITKGLGIQPYYLSKSVLLPTLRFYDGYTYKCLDIGATTEISCIIADRAGLMSERGILIIFNKGYDGQIILLKDLQSYGSGNGYFWVMPSGCNIINANNSGILVGRNQISNAFDDGRSRFLVYSSWYDLWIEFLCS